MRAAIRKSIELLLTRSGLPVVTRFGRRGSTLILAYHNVVPHSERATGDQSLHITQRAFAAHLDAIAETHDVIPLGGLYADAADGRRPRLIITFDDAYQGALTAGIEEIARRGLPATVFVTPAFVGGRSFWWDEIAAARGGQLPEAVRKHAIEQLAGRYDAVRSWAVTEGIAMASVAWHERAATEEQLHAATTRPHVELAAHSWSHANLARLPKDDLIPELTRPSEWLRARFARVSPWLSYPYGLRSTATEAHAESTGYAGGLLIEGGWTDQGARTRRFAIPRLNVPAGMSVHGLRLRAAGLFPMGAATAAEPAVLL